MSVNTESRTNPGSVSQVQILLGILFAGSLLTANVTAAKLSYFNIPFFGGVAVPAGFIAIAVAFLCSDLMVEFYGREYAHKTINATVIMLGIAYALIWLAIYLPVAPFYDGHTAYVETLGASGSIIIASIVTILVAQHVDVNVFHRIKEVTGDGHRWARNLGSTSISQLIDTVIFITLGFAIFPTFFGGEPIYGMALASMILGQYLVKLGVAVIDTPVFYLITSAKTVIESQTDRNGLAGTFRSSD